MKYASTENNNLAIFFHYKDLNHSMASAILYDPETDEMGTGVSGLGILAAGWVRYVTAPSSVYLNGAIVFDLVTNHYQIKKSGNASGAEKEASIAFKKLGKSAEYISDIKAIGIIMGLQLMGGQSLGSY